MDGAAQRVADNRRFGELARPAGFEPATYRLEGGCSNPLSYGRPIAG